MRSFTDAVEHVWSNGCKDTCGVCSLCNLSVCEICGQYEGGLPTHCPGAGFDPDVHKVYEGECDYRYGQWVSGIRNRVMTRGIIDAYDNEEKFLNILMDNPAENAKYMDEVKTYMAGLAKNIKYVVKYYPLGVTEEALYLHNDTELLYFETASEARQAIQTSDAPQEQIVECCVERVVKFKED